MSDAPPRSVIRLALPKGRMQAGVQALLRDAGIRIEGGEREYRPAISLPGYDTKILKPQNIVEMLHLGSRDVGFAGNDWVEELGLEVISLLDTELDPVRLVAAAPRTLFVDGELPKRKLVVASEYERLAQQWIEKERLDATFVRSYGATEVFPPEDADIIVDNTATGATLRENGLAIVSELTRSSTRFFACPRALDDASRRSRIEELCLLLRSVLEARRRVMVEVNVGPTDLERVLAILPCMRHPTIAPLAGESGFAVKAAVPRTELPALIPQLKARGGTDIVVSAIGQIVV